MRILEILTRGFFLMFIAMASVSCSGKGDGSGGTPTVITLSPLIVTDKVSVVTPQASPVSGKPLSTGNQGIASLIFGAVTISDLTSSSDYASDTVSVFVSERSLESFSTVNELLCSLRQSRYDAMLNRGPYLAQVDKNLCSSTRSSASSAGQSSTDPSAGTTMPKYETWTVTSSRASANAPHLVRAWVHSAPEQGVAPTITYAQVIITEGADSAPPYGLFTADFKALDPNDLSTILYKGFLNAERDPSSGKVLLKFAVEDKDSYIMQKATLYKEPNGASGVGSVYETLTIPGMAPSATRFNIAYDPSYFLRTDNLGTNICLDRLSFDESSWKYGLYDPTDGSRISLNTGFPVRLGGVYGWIGYWGSWFPDGTTVQNNDTVVKHDYATNTDDTFTVLKAGGKLSLFTRNTTTLGAIGSIPLIWSDGAGTNYLVNWDGSKFAISARQDPADYTWGTCGQTATCPAEIDLTSLPSTGLAFMSQALNGIVFAIFPGPGAGTGNDCTGAGPYNCSASVSGNTPVILYKVSVVTPADTVPSTLACFDNCPDVAGIASAAPFRTDISSYQSGTAPALATYAAYTFDMAMMNLLDTRTTPTAVQLKVRNAAFPNGVSSGPLFDPTPANLALLACDWDAGSTCGGKAWSVLPSFYSWETGTNAWNQYTSLKDGAENPVIFDQPIQIQYVHSQPTVTAPDNKYDGTTFYLEYSGFGDLHGIPGMCVNMDTGQTNVDCGLASTDPAVRWVPEFSIPDSRAGELTEVRNAAFPTTTYLVKTLEKEQRMNGVSTNKCTDPPAAGSGLSTSPYTLPSMSSWVDPNIGSEPVITAPPAVVGGVVQ